MTHQEAKETFRLAAKLPKDFFAPIENLDLVQELVNSRKLMFIFVEDAALVMRAVFPKGHPFELSESAQRQYPEGLLHVPAELIQGSTKTGPTLARTAYGTNCLVAHGSFEPVPAHIIIPTMEPNFQRPVL